MDQQLEFFAALAAPFMPEEVRVRSQGARQLQYITARTVMNRLDDVLGPANWWDEYMPLENSVICRLTIRLPDGTTLTKSDAGGYAGMADSGDDDKSGFSDAFKCAAVKFGIGRYLYRDGVPRFVHERMRHPSLAADPTQHAHAFVACTSTSRAGSVELPARWRWARRTAIWQGPLRLDQEAGRETRVRPAQDGQRLGQTPGFPGADGSMECRTGAKGVHRGTNGDSGDPNHPD